MNPSDLTESGEGPRQGEAAFLTTRWSVVLSAGSTDAPQAAPALEHLCRTYWYPLYAHVRRLGHGAAESEDLTQGFFSKLIEKNWLAAADAERGRFRSFLLGALKHFLANEWDRSRAKKRGGGVQFVPLDASAGETRWRIEPATDKSPEREFDRRWALTLLDTVLSRLGAEYTASGKAHVFEKLKGTLEGDHPENAHSVIAGALQVSPGAVRVAAHRFRQRYRELLRDEIAQTLAVPGDIEAEMHHLFDALST